MCIIGSSITRRQDAIIIRSPGHCFTNSVGMMSYSKFSKKRVPSLIKYKLQIQTTHQIINFTTVEGRNQRLNTHNRKAEIEREGRHRERQIERERESEGGRLGTYRRCERYLLRVEALSREWRVHVLEGWFQVVVTTTPVVGHVQQIQGVLQDHVGTPQRCLYLFFLQPYNNVEQRSSLTVLETFHSKCSNSNKNKITFNYYITDLETAMKNLRIKSFSRRAGFYLKKLDCLKARTHKIYI